MVLKVWSPNQKHQHHPHLLEMQILSPHPISTESETLYYRSPAGGLDASLFESHCAISNTVAIKGEPSRFRSAKGST